MSAPTTVIAEVWPVSADTVGIWLLSGDDAWRSQPITQDSDPHSAVEELLSEHKILTDVKMLNSTSWRAGILHSTSWRAEGESIVLTYVAVIDCDDFVRDDWPDAVPVAPEIPEVVGKAIEVNAAEAPFPRYIDVLLHGLRHLTFLLYTDSSARNALSETWRDHLAALRPALAGMYDHENDQAPITLPDVSTLQEPTKGSVL